MRKSKLVKFIELFLMITKSFLVLPLVERNVCPDGGAGGKVRGHSRWDI